MREHSFLKVVAMYDRMGSCVTDGASALASSWYLNERFPAHAHAHVRR